MVAEGESSHLPSQRQLLVEATWGISEEDIVVGSHIVVARNVESCECPAGRVRSG